MSGPAPSAPPPLDPDRDHVRGEGRRTLVVYGDFECPYTRMAWRGVQRLEREGLAFRLVFRPFPLAEIHPHALQAAVAAEAADDQGRYWDMHEALFRHQRALERDDLRRYAADLGLDAGRFEDEFASDGQLERITTSVRGGLESGVHGTPTLFVDGMHHRGYDPEELRAALA